MSGFGGPPPAAGAPRLGYLDWARGLAVLVMIQTHALLAWTAPADRSRPLLGLARLAGGYPAALFLFLAGLAAALMIATAVPSRPRSRAAARSTPAVLPSAAKAVHGKMGKNASGIRPLT